MDRSSIRDSNSFLPRESGLADPRKMTPETEAADFGPAAIGEESRWLLEISGRDLDAALQLLADRAQYMTGASGAAIALRSLEHENMICRASTGSSAPPLGSLLSTEQGLSGESVRTLQLQRCNNAQHDARVNSESCRRLGIASVLVMPIISRDRAIGVFELFSGKAYAFDEPAIEALQRLSAMVETAVRFGSRPESLRGVSAAAETEASPSLGPEPAPLPSTAAVPHSPDAPPPSEAQKPESQPASKKPFFWSAAAHAGTSSRNPETSASATAIPPVLSNLQKCQACGFPISKDRTYCVECEEKQWRGRK